MQIEVSIGEIVDKLAILQIKRDRMEDKTKLKNVIREFEYLYDIVFNKLQIEFTDYTKLVDINTQLWIIEDDIRVKEYRKEFDNKFVSLARSVYVTNDKRAQIKKDINHKYNSNFVEEKSYVNYENTN